MGGFYRVAKLGKPSLQHYGNLEHVAEFREVSLSQYSVIIPSMTSHFAANVVWRFES